MELALLELLGGDVRLFYQLQLVLQVEVRLIRVERGGGRAGFLTKVGERRTEMVRGDMNAHIGCRIRCSCNRQRNTVLCLTVQKVVYKMCRSPLGPEGPPAERRKEEE